MERFSALLITEDQGLKGQLFDALRGNELVHILTISEARERLGAEDFSVVVIDGEFSGAIADDIASLTVKGSEPPIVAAVEEGAMDVAASAIAAGAFDYIFKPLDAPKALNAVQKAVEAGAILRQTVLLKPRISGSDGSLPLLAALKTIARSDAPALIQGEPGTGVDVIARALHVNSHRRDAPFSSVDCQSLPTHLLESEIFGYEKGAVAGGVVRKTGQAELAEGGTLFLMNITALGLAAQQKLSRAIADKTLELGPDASINWNTRIIASAEHSLEEPLRSRMFREDLHRLICGVSIFLPPLRERKEDIPGLVNFLLELYRKMHKRGPIVFSETILKRLAENPWPGNLKELEKAIERYVLAGAMPQSREMPTVEEVTGIQPPRSSVKTPPKPNPLRDASRGAEREAIIKTLKECGGNKRLAARTLNISYKTLFNKLHQYNIATRKEFG